MDIPQPVEKRSILWLINTDFDLSKHTKLIFSVCKNMTSPMLLLRDIIIFNTTFNHYSDIVMSMMASQITSVSIVCLSICSGADQRKHQSFVALALVRGIHWWPEDSPHKGPLTRKMFPFDHPIMCGRHPKQCKISQLAYKIHHLSWPTAPLYTPICVKSSDFCWWYQWLSMSEVLSGLTIDIPRVLVSCRAMCCHIYYGCVVMLMCSHISIFKNIS